MSNKPRTVTLVIGFNIIMTGDISMNISLKIGPFSDASDLVIVSAPMKVAAVDHKIDNPIFLSSAYAD
ncbi:MAG: hypothetical protein ACJA1S_000020 [Cellvibrionaceae bacterium]|jgi:hypothetical protein